MSYCPDFPYTDRQVQQFANCEAVSFELARTRLNRLNRAGITVNFRPEPRFYVEGSDGIAYVRDRQKADLNAAWFEGPDAATDARVHASRLNTRHDAGVHP